MKKHFFLLVSFISIVFTIASGQEFKYKEFKELKGYDGYLMEARFSPFNNYFAITVGTNEVQILNKNWEAIFEHQGDAKYYAGQADFSPDEKYLAVSRYKSPTDIAIVKLPEGVVVDVLMEHSFDINDVAFSPDGKYLASCGDDKTINVWKITNGKFELIYKGEDHKTRTNNLTFSNDSRFLISVSNDKTVLIKEILKDKVVDFQRIVDGKYYLKTVAYHPVKQEFVVGCTDKITIWSLAKDKFIKKDSIADGVGSNYSIEFSPNGEYMAVTINAVVRIWSYKPDAIKVEKTIERPVAIRYNAYFSQDGKYLSISSMNDIIIWELEGVTPSTKAVIADYLGGGLTPAQIKVLTRDNAEKILALLDKNLTAPRDEFETSEAYEARMKKLESVTLAQVQKMIEQHYKVNYKQKEQKIYCSIDELSGYDADKQVYKLKVLGSDCEVKIPVDEAKYLKENWNKAIITASKKISKDNQSFTYSNFQLKHPASGKEYALTMINPFASLAEVRTLENVPTKPEMTVKDAEKDNSGRDYGKTYALFFVTNEYDDPFVSDLINPVFDGNTIKDELKNNYGANVELIANPGLDEMVSKLRDYASLKYNPNDKLVIFFAGHGIFDDVFKEGYIIARDSKYADESKLSYLSHSNLRTIVNNIPCDHILLVLDVCFGGTFDPVIASRSVEDDLYKEVTKSEFIQRKMKYKTRLYITSGGKEYVPDGRAGHHSPFARQFLEALRTYGGEDGIVTLNEILVFLEKVNPEPRFGEFGDNEPGSDFILIVK
ncbi:MAG: caspase family protein [Bacteroidales bacterium]|nr:caspase family protein [Bacteroidales bacterium]